MVHSDVPAGEREMQGSEYNPEKIEKKWQKYWKENETFAVDLDQVEKPNYYILTMYPYPSGVLHTGHVMEYSISDLVARYNRMKGYNVFFPMGWDSFGLPAENAAIKQNTHPAAFTSTNIDRMRTQMKRAGWSITWDSEISTSHPGFYCWNQWIFLKMLEKGLAYKKEAAVNWCPVCRTVLANEQVIDGKCERHGVDVTQKQLDQWFLKITDFAQDMLDDMPEGWDREVALLQADWIGRSEGSRVDFTIESTGEILPVFTTRADTLFGVTYMSIAPEHPLIEKLTAGTDREAEVRAFVDRVTRVPSYLRSAESAEKEGIFTGHHVLNPVNGEMVQLWVANYALMEYGTGAVMAVPAHDQRDFEFARKYGLPIRVVISPEHESCDPESMTEAFIDEGVMVNSGRFDDMPSRDAADRITEYISGMGKGGSTINYRLRDWLVSRQRYWGTPIPVIYCDSCGIVPVPEDGLPVLLPESVDFNPTGVSPLASVEEFVNTECPECGGPARRETDTMDTFVDSSWYFFRYLSSRDESRIFDVERIKKWFPIDQYIGGIEHARGHLVFSRFFTKFLAGIGVQPFHEYADRLFPHGMVLKDAYHCPNCNWVHIDDLEEDGTCGKCGAEVKTELTKMSKTKLNTVSPDFLFEKYGADATRLYILFMGPPNKSTEFNSQGLIGVTRFLTRLHGQVIDRADALKGVSPYSGDGGDLSKETRELRSKLHRTIRKVTSDFEAFGYNTAVAAIMECFNVLRATPEPDAAIERKTLETLLLLLSPMTPHFSEELWEKLGHAPSIQAEPWPEYDEDASREEEIEVVFQVNGKVRGRALVSAGASEDTLEEFALGNDGVKRLIEGKTVRKVIVVRGRLVNVVVN